jgi:hypothetical protein
LLFKDFLTSSICDFLTGALATAAFAGAATAYLTSGLSYLLGCTILAASLIFASF